MAYKHKPGKGSLFKNDEKEEETHADYRGKITLLDGTECWINAWINETEGDGRKYLGLALKEIQPRQQPRQQGPQRGREAPYGGGRTQREPEPQQQAPAPQGTFDDFDDDIPF